MLHYEGDGNVEPRIRLFGSISLFGLGLVLAAKIVLPLVAPFVVGLVLACVLEPMVVFCERRGRLPRSFASAGVLAATMAGLCFFLLTVGLNLWFGLRDLALAAARGGRIERLLDTLAGAASVRLRGLPEPLREAFLAWIGELPARLAGLLEYCLAGLRHLPQWLLFCFLGILAAYFFSRDRETCGRFLTSLVPREWRARAIGMKEDLFRALMGFVRAQLLLILLTFALGTLGLAVLGVRHAVLCGVVLGLLDFLPLIGPGALLLPWGGLLLVCGAWGKGLGFIVLFAVLALGREAAEARLVGRNLGLHPLAALASLYIGTRLFGLSGILLGPITLVILRALYEALTLPGARGEIRLGAKEVRDEKDRHPRFNRVHRAADT